MQKARKKTKTKTKNYPMIHYVPDTDKTPFGIDAHTHGLDAYNHLELECILPVSQDNMVSIINPLIKMIVEGEPLSEGCRRDLLINDYQMYFIEVKDIWDSNKSVLRIIIPDEENKMPWDEGCDSIYASQGFDIPIEKIHEVTNKK